MLTTILLVALAALAVYVWKYLKNINQYWKERGVPFKAPLPFIGNNKSMILRKEGLGEIHRSVYRMFPNEPYYGFYDFLRPVLVIKDLELVEQILVKDFHHFMDHGFIQNDAEIRPTDTNLFNLNGNKWRATRNKFSPMFTTGKLRHMVPQMEELSQKLTMELGKHTKGVELKDFFQRFAMDVIGSCAFGLSMNSIEEKEESEFRQMGKLAFKVTFTSFLRFVTLQCFPKLAAFLKLSQNNPTSTKYFAKILRETLAHRKETGQTRLDFVQLMVTLQDKGFIEFEGDETDDYLRTEKDEKATERYELTSEAMVGHAFVFLVAGFEATANGLMYLFYDLASNPEIQKQVRKEVAEKVKAKGGVLDYDTIKDMTYLNQCVKESTRLHSAVTVLFRVCTKEYTIPGTSLTLQPGQVVYIPVDAIHKDPAVYPEPEKFDPERFSSDAVRPNCSYLAFGDGPRVCIAMRFALTEIKLCAAKLLLNYEFKVSPKTKLPIEVDPLNFITMPKYPVYFDLVKNEVS